MTLGAFRTRHIWLAFFLLPGILFLTLFVPAISGAFYAAVKPTFYAALVIGFLALGLEWVKAFRVKNHRQWLMSIFLSAIYLIYSLLLVLAYLVTHSGI